MKKVSAFFILVLALSACGSPGPLYQTKEPAAKQENTKQTKQTQGSQG